ncbi:TPA: DUF551 domain-containing protein [Escherichia coli]|nr:DUF551 domain-containing protein [Escherichia coli]
MAEFTKEQLIEKLERRLAVTTHYPDFEEAQLDAQIFKIALEALTAGMEQEPVAWLLSGGGAKNNVSFDSGNAYADPLREVTPLYASPPAPVSVPAAMEMDDDFDSAFEHGKAVGWNAYRAAMLQSFGNSEQLNSPVIQDGWVACVERMPEKADEVLCAKEFDGPGDWRQKVGYYLAGKWTVYSASWTPTHWMPLPAAPRQEVK